MSKYILVDPTKVTCVDMEKLAGLTKGTIQRITVTPGGHVIPETSRPLTMSELATMASVFGRAVTELTSEEETKYDLKR